MIMIVILIAIKGYVLYFGEKALILVWLVFAEEDMMSNSFETMTVIVFSVDAIWNIAETGLSV